MAVGYVFNIKTIKQLLGGFIMKEYYSNITIRFGGNNLEANSEKEYIELIKEQFYESYRIDLVDS